MAFFILMAAALEGDVLVTGSDSDETTATVDLPDSGNGGGEPVEGEVIELHIVVDGNTLATASGWTTKTSDQAGPISGFFFVREVTSGNQSETTFDVTLGASQAWQSFTRRVSGLEDGVNSIESSVLNFANNGFNPDNLDPSWAANSTLWATVLLNNNGADTPSGTGQPSGYTMDAFAATGTTNGVAGAIASRTDLDAASEDPAAWVPGYAGGRAAGAYTVGYEDGTGSAAPAVTRRSFTLLGIGR